MAYLCAVSCLCAGLGCSDMALEPCDISSTVCQDDVYFALQRLRGDGWDAFGSLPPVEVIGRDTYRARLEAQLPDEPVEVEPSPAERALQLLGVVTEDQSPAQSNIDNQVDNTAAFYSGSGRSVTVIDHGQQADRSEARLRSDTIVLAHELVHAIQDREVALRAPSGGTDAWFSYRAAVEGEAELYETLIALEIDGANPRDPNVVEWLQNNHEGGLAYWKERIATAESPHYAAGWIVYPLAAKRFLDRWLEGGNAAVRTLYGDRPEGVWRWMAGPDRQAPGAPPLACQLQAPDGFWAITNDRFGAAHAYAMLVSDWMQDVDPPEGIEQAWERALTWVDDRLVGFHHPERDVVLVEWRIRFATREDATAAAELLKPRARREVEVVGRDLRLRASDDPLLLDDWEGLRCDAD